MIQILVVEDDLQLNQIICSYLNKNDYLTTGCNNPNEAYNLMYDTNYDLIISDIMMPGINGFEFAKTIRDINSSIPILFISARDDIGSKQKGFSLGIDDYLVKPFHMDELVLRVTALLRRANIANEKRLSIENLVLDANEITAYFNDEEIKLTVREFNILYKLLSYPKRTFTRAQLIEEFWGLESDSSLRTVDVYITKLRDKFSNCSIFEIVTVHGLGYKAVVK